MSTLTLGFSILEDLSADVLLQIIRNIDNPTALNDIGQKSFQPDIIDSILVSTTHPLKTGDRDNHHAHFKAQHTHGLMAIPKAIYTNQRWWGAYLKNPADYLWGLYNLARVEKNLPLLAMLGFDDNKITWDERMKAVKDQVDIVGLPTDIDIISSMGLFLGENGQDCTTYHHFLVKWFLTIPKCNELIQSRTNFPDVDFNFIQLCIVKSHAGAIQLMIDNNITISHEVDYKSIANDTLKIEAKSNLFKCFIDEVSRDVDHHVPGEIKLFELMYTIITGITVIPDQPATDEMIKSWNDDIIPHLTANPIVLSLPFGEWEIAEFCHKTGCPFDLELPQSHRPQNKSVRPLDPWETTLVFYFMCCYRSFLGPKRARGMWDFIKKNTNKATFDALFIPSNNINNNILRFAYFKSNPFAQFMFDEQGAKFNKQLDTFMEINKVGLGKMISGDQHMSTVHLLLSLPSSSFQLGSSFKMNEKHAFPFHYFQDWAHKNELLPPEKELDDPWGPMNVYLFPDPEHFNLTPLHAAILGSNFVGPEQIRKFFEYPTKPDFNSAATICYNMREQRYYVEQCSALHLTVIRSFKLHEDDYQYPQICQELIEQYITNELIGK